MHGPGHPCSQAVRRLPCRGAPGWSENGRLLAGRDDWCCFLITGLADEFAIKPVCGGHGRGFNIIRRNGGGFVDARGRTFSVEGLHDVLLAGATDGGVVIQERLMSHSDLVRLGGTEFLQTVRMMTLIDGRGRCRILHAHLKSIVGGKIIDNFQHGLSGNISARVDLATGRLQAAARIAGSGGGVETVVRHPETGVPFDGFALPYWNDACRLVRRGAVAMLPLRTLGWDVALTPDGVRIVEANAWWDPPNQHGCMPGLMEALQAATETTD